MFKKKIFVMKNKYFKIYLVIIFGYLQIYFKFGKLFRIKINKF